MTDNIKEKNHKVESDKSTAFTGSAFNKSYRAWFIRALFRSLTVIVLVMIAVFFIIRLVPGDPAVMVLGEHADEAAVEALRQKLHLDMPAGQQFVLFIRSILTSFDTGISIKYGVSCRSLVLQYAPVTLSLILLSMLITVVLTVILAFGAAMHRDGILDHLIRVIPAFTEGMPVFWVGLLLILFFAVKLGWFPVGGVGSGGTAFWKSLVLPAVTIAFGQIPPLIRSLREQLIEVLDADFVVTLKAARIPKRQIFIRHVLRNSFVPTLMLMSVNLSYLIGGTLIVEKVFAVRGMGKLLFDAISNRDFPLVQAVALYCAIFVVIISLVTDMIAHRADPRMLE